MWIFHFFKYALGSSFDYFSTRIKGRFVAFALQMVLSYVLVGAFTGIIAMLALPLFYDGSFSFDLFSSEFLYNWAVLITPVWTVSIVIGVNYLFRTNASEERMKFADFYSKRTSSFWGELFVTICLLTILFIVYNSNTIYFSPTYPNDLEYLLNEGFGENMGFLGMFLKNWLYYISLALPIVSIVILEIRERKRNGATLKQPLWKIIIVAILLGFFVSWTMDAFLRMFGELVLSLIYAPFEMIEIPIVLGIITSIFFVTFKFIALAAVYHFTIQYGTQEDEERVLFLNTSEDLLDN